MKKASIIIGMMLAMILAVSSSSMAADIYVNYGTGNDTTGNGSSGTPYKTFHKGYTEASNSDRLILHGTFDWTNADETGDSATTGYTIAKNITILGYGPDTTIIQAAGSAGSADRRVFTTSNYEVTFEDLTIRYGYMNVDGGHGTAIFSSSGTLTIENCDIYQCSNMYDRYINGAIYKSLGTLTMKNSALYDNDNGYVGGIYLSAAAVITNCTFYDNFGQYGGGIMVLGSNEITLTNVTLADNACGYGFGGNICIQGGNPLTIRNSILANDQGGTDYYVFSGTTVDGGYNIVESSTGFTFSGTGTITGEQANLWGSGVSATPAPADNGGPTHTIAPAAGSVAIDQIPQTAGGNTYNSCPPIDQRIYGRPTGSGTTDNRDIGACEYNAATAIDLVSFTAKRLPTRVKVEWETEAEVNTTGFHLWRTDGLKKDYVRVTEWVIPAVGGPAQGAEYLWLDTSAMPGTPYWYKLQEITDAGLSTYHGPVKAMGKKPGTPGK